MVVETIEHRDEHILVHVLFNNTVQFPQTVARQLGIPVGIHAELDHAHGDGDADKKPKFITNTSLTI